jgi:hypothetical protein
MELLAIHQSPRVLPRYREAVETPAVADDADFEEIAILCVLFCLRILLGQVEEALLRLAALVGAENDLPGVCFRAG